MSGPRPRPPDERRVAAMFDRVAARYDLVNSLLSFGLDRTWRRQTARAVKAPPGAWVLDLGSGTGALGGELARRYRVVAVDVSVHMLTLSATRAGSPVHEVAGSAFALPLRDATLAGVASTFVLRNLDDLPAAFAELARVLRPGASLALLDIVAPRGRLLRRAFDAYFSTAAPALGAAVGRRRAYEYLVRSLAQLPPPAEVASLLGAAGFGSPRHRALFPGPVTLWTGTRT